jgi:hypothetical protein
MDESEAGLPRSVNPTGRVADSGRRYVGTLDSLTEAAPEHADRVAILLWKACVHAWIGSSRVMDGRTHSRTRRNIA